MNDRVGERAANVHQHLHAPSLAPQLLPGRQRHDHRREERGDVPIQEVERQEVRQLVLHAGVVLEMIEPVRLQRRRQGEGRRDDEQEPSRNARALTHSVLLRPLSGHPSRAVKPENPAAAPDRPFITAAPRLITPNPRRRGPSRTPGVRRSAGPFSSTWEPGSSLAAATRGFRPATGHISVSRARGRREHAPMLARTVLALSLAVRVYDNTGVPPGDRATALAAAHDILKDAGIAVTWRDDDNVPAPAEVIVRIVTAPGGGASRSARLLVDRRRAAGGHPRDRVRRSRHDARGALRRRPGPAAWPRHGARDRPPAPRHNPPRRPRAHARRLDERRTPPRSGLGLVAVTRGRRPHAPRPGRPAPTPRPARRHRRPEPTTGPSQVRGPKVQKVQKVRKVRRGPLGPARTVDSWTARTFLARIRTDREGCAFIMRSHVRYPPSGGASVSRRLSRRYLLCGCCADPIQAGAGGEAKVLRCRSEHCRHAGGHEGRPCHVA